MSWSNFAHGKGLSEMVRKKIALLGPWESSITRVCKSDDGSGGGTDNIYIKMWRKSCLIMSTAFIECQNPDLSSKGTGSENLLLTKLAMPSFSFRVQHGQSISATLSFHPALLCSSV